VHPFTFDADLVRRNFALLPLPDTRPTKIPCLDGLAAKSSKPDPGYIPHGGVPHRYVRVVLRCGKCGAAKAPNSCGKCRKVNYCGKDCQVADWKERHKHVCKSMAKATATATR
jgi:hypothetical protein